MSEDDFSAVLARADDELDMLKDTCHDQFDRIKDLEEKIDRAMTLITAICEECPKRECCSEEECMFYNIEEILE